MHSSSGGFFGRRNKSISADIANDPTIVAAREKVHSAEDAELAADKALDQARAAVKEARGHVQFLERETREE